MTTLIYTASDFLCIGATRLSTFFSWLDEELTSEERKTLESLCEQKVTIVLERNKIVDQMEEERVQDQKEETDVGLEGDYDPAGSSSETSEGCLDLN